MLDTIVESNIIWYIFRNAPLHHIVCVVIYNEAVLKQSTYKLDE